MSNFGADIFDQEPESKDPGVKPEQQDEANSPQREEKAAEGGKKPARSTGRRRTKDSKPAAAEGADQANTTDPQPPEATEEPSEAEASPAHDQPSTSRRRRSSSRNRKSSDPAPEPQSSPRKSSRATTAGSKPRTRSRANKDAATGASTQGRSAQARQRGKAAQTNQISVLIDYVALQEEARKAGGELALLKLVGILADNRSVFSAKCYVVGDPGDNSTPRPSSSISVQTCADAQSAAVAMAIDATDLSSRCDTLILAPFSQALSPLLAAMKDRGVSVEIASFTDEGPDGTRSRRLGNNCLFVP